MNTVYKVGVQIDGNAKGMARAAKEAQEAAKTLGTGVTREFNKMAKARETLGIRAERDVQREIYRTEAAYNRLARSGTLSFAEQQRAAQAMRNEISKLNAEMGRVEKTQRKVPWKTIAGGAGAAVGAGMVMLPKVQTAAAYDVRLAHLANTAFNDRDKGGRVAGRKELDLLIQDAVRYGGGTRDGAIGAAETLYGSGVFKPADVKQILREAVMAATANNADPQAFAQMAISASQTLGIKPGEMGRMFGMGTFAGQAGGFEVKDMAKWLPQQMAAAKAVGLFGEKGFAKLAAVNQGAVVTAGTKDEAGNNVVNLLAKMGSQDTIKDFKKQGIDLPKKLAEGRMKGLDAFDVVGNLLDSQLANDKNYQQVKKQLANAKNSEERNKALEAVGNIAQGTTIGKVFQDRQALMALYGFMNGRDRVNSIAGESFENPDAAMKNMAVIRETASSVMEHAANELAIAQQKTMDKMLPAISLVSDKLAGLVKEYPGYTTAIMGATGALTGLAGAAGLAALAMRPGAALPGGAGLPGGFGRFMANLGKLLGPAGVLLAMEGVSSEDVARLRAYEARTADKGGRGYGFNDSRLVGSDTRPFSERALSQRESRGVIEVQVSAAPGTAVDSVTVNKSSGLRITGTGQTNLAAGH